MGIQSRALVNVQTTLTTVRTIHFLAVVNKLRSHLNDNIPINFTHCNNDCQTTTANPTTLLMHPFAKAQTQLKAHKNN